VTSNIVQLKSEKIWDGSPWTAHLVVLLRLREELNLSFLGIEQRNREDQNYLPITVKQDLWCNYNANIRDQIKSRKVHEKYSVVLADKVKRLTFFSNQVAYLES
jgi:hypothetical protein